jgi:hypothetical protein
MPHYLNGAPTSNYHRVSQAAEREQGTLAGVWVFARVVSGCFFVWMLLTQVPPRLPVAVELFNLLENAELQLRRRMVSLASRGGCQQPSFP